jgi:hypothetical protein
MSREFGRTEDRPTKGPQPDALITEPAESESAATAAFTSSSAYPTQIKAEDYKMGDGEKGAFQGFFEAATALYGTESARKIAVLSIGTGERLAKGVLDFQAKTTEWAKDTPLGALFEAQNSIGRKFVELSADAARRLWRVDESRAA